MKKEELRAELRQKGIPEEFYNIDGTGRKDERFCLEKVNNIWNVYFSERGIKTTELTFDSEDDACEYIYKQLVD